MSDRYAVIGNPVEHSLSPAIHPEFARATGQDIVYEKILAPLDGFRDAAFRFRDEGGKGLNVTLPFKHEAWLVAGLRSGFAWRPGRSIRSPSVAAKSSATTRTGLDWYATSREICRCLYAASACC